MAVGKGSMDRASKTAAKTGTKQTKGKEPAVKETAVKTSSVVTGTSEEVMEMIEYQKSSQVLDREPEANEIFGVGEAMPIYFF